MTTDGQPTTLLRPKRTVDILDAIAALSSDAVPTPPVLARAMLDLLPDEVWTNPDYKWLDPAVKSGSILREVASRLMVGLADWEPDPHKRAKHIMTDMLHGLSITTLHAEMGRRSVYRSKDAVSEKAVGRGEFFEDHEGNIRFVHADHSFKKSARGLDTGNCEICGAPVGLERGFDRENYAYAFIHDQTLMERLTAMKFDVVIGNPPYQIGQDDTTRARPIYQYFIQSAIALNPKYVVMIAPSRWFTGGLGLDEFRDRMISDRHLKEIVDNPKVFDCFPGVTIQGGVNYFLWDRDHNDDCKFSTRVDGVVRSTATRDLRAGDGIVIRDNRAVGIVEKVKSAGLASATGLVQPRLAFSDAFRTNFRGSVSKEAPGALPIIHNSGVGYVSSEEVVRGSHLIPLWKVLLPMAYGGGQGISDSGTLRVTVIGVPVAISPGSVCTESYFVVGAFASRGEAENYAQYLATKFARFLILQRKSTQHITPDRFRFVPAVDMTRAWTDDDLYSYFGLAQDEIAYIEETINPREASILTDVDLPSAPISGGGRLLKSFPLDLEEDDE